MYLPAQHLSTASTSTIMSGEDADESGEDFGGCPTSSSSDDDNDTDERAEFQPVAHNWSPDEQNVLQRRVDDWKASKNRKAQRLIVEGAMADLFSLPVQPPKDRLQEVSNNPSMYSALLINMMISVLELGTDKMLVNHQRQLSARFLNGAQ
jgi:hypothetical protein